MAKRPKIPKKTETEVLKRSRRRCCICFGLDGDDATKKGQIAHLDGDPSNNDIGNLAWLCFNHHEEYDSKTSQSKKLTRHEVETYRQDLYEHYCTGVQPTPTPAASGSLLLADDPPVFKPNPKTFASNPELILGGRVVNMGERAISLGFTPEVRTLDSDGHDLGCAKDIRAQYRVRKPQERLSRESIAPSFYRAASASP